MGWWERSLYDFPLWNIFMMMVSVFLAFKGTLFVGCEIQKKTFTVKNRLFNWVQNFYGKMLLRISFALAHYGIALVILMILAFVFTCFIRLIPGDCTM
jgi:hypothetical protein